MNRKLVVIGTVVLACGVGIAVFGPVQRRLHPAPSPTTTHGNGIDHSMSAVLALYKAPPGATPCESAYNAFQASQDYAAQHSVTAVVLRLAPHDEFIARCTAQPTSTQQCLVPLYLSEHREECRKARPPDDVLDALVQVKHPSEPGSPQGSEPGEPEPAPVGSR
jgi:hypothetical protein